MLALTVVLWNLLAIASCSTDPESITAEPGQTITLPCRASINRPVRAVEWSRTDLESDYVLLYRNDQIDPELQHPSYQNRVDLQDRQMKDGDVSLVLNNVTINDGGTYECRVFYDGPDLSEKLLSTIHLSVRSPGDQDGDSGGRLVLIAQPVLVIIDAAAVCLWKKKKNSPPDSTPQEKQLEASEMLKRNQDGGNKDLGNEDGGNQDGGNKDLGNEDGGNQDGRTEDGD